MCTILMLFVIYNETSIALLIKSSTYLWLRRHFASFQENWKQKGFIASTHLLFCVLFQTISLSDIVLITVQVPMAVLGLLFTPLFR